MREERELNGVDLIPEPSDYRIMSAVDTSTRGYQESWRSETMGWDPSPVPVISRPRRAVKRIANASVFVLTIIVVWGIWKSQLLVFEIPPPTSEWAFEDSGVRDLQAMGYTGEGVRLCMVDTGIDISNDDLNGIDLVFKDFLSNSYLPTDYGSLAHGTMMAGIVAADGHLNGIAPGVTLGMAAALGDNGEGDNSGDQEDVAKAIEWCWRSFDAHIISLSLGGTSNPESQSDGPTVNAVLQAMDNGVYVVAAAGNDGGSADDGVLSTPANVNRVISVAALDRNGDIWEGSSLGGSIDKDGEVRENPHLKPEISAPGVDIVSTAVGDEFYSSTGTSDATAFVSGILALILEAEPELKNVSGSSCIDEVKSALMSSATPLEEDVSHNQRCGYGAIYGKMWLRQIRSTSACGVI